jgi:hypothetical protein
VRGAAGTILLLFGGLAVIVGVAAVGSGDVLERIVSPPAPIRAGLVGIMVVAGLALGRAALERFRMAGTGGSLTDADPVVMLRGIRLSFLSLAAFAAAAGWLLAHPLPLVVAAIVAAVDVAETSLLLLVSSGGRPRGP